MAKKSEARTNRRARMVAAKIAGASTTSIARAEGLSRDWTAKELASAECRQILAGLVDGNLQRIAALFTQTLTAIGEAMRADKVVFAEGCAMNLGADHFARLTAAKRFLELVTLGRAPLKAPEEGKGDRTITLEELERLVASRSKAAVQ